MTRTPKEKIILEQVKDRHTSHWDLDMLSRAELEALMAARDDASGDGDAPQSGSGTGSSSGTA